MSTLKRISLLSLLVSSVLAVQAATNKTQARDSHHPTSSGAKNAERQEAHKSTSENTSTTATAPQNSTMGMVRSRNLDDISHRLDQSEQPVEQELDTRAPFWNIAHMINSIEQIDLALSAGSNGIETDVSFAASGMPVEAYHGFPCDCGRHCHHREDFTKFVRQLSRLTTATPTNGSSATSRLLLVLFDLKLKDLKDVRQKEAAGRYLAEILHKNLYGPYQLATRIRSADELERAAPYLRPPLRVVISINHAHDLPLVKSFIAFMQQNRLDFMSRQVGFDVGMNDELDEIIAAWDQLNGATLNIWQGDGLTNCANIVRGVERLKQALAIRNGQGHFRKVYYWTVDVMYHIRAVLRLGLDAVLTNQPRRVVQVLEEAEFRHKFRMATPWDDPFQQYWIQPTASNVKPPSVGEALETAVNLHQTGTNFIRTLPDGISAALRKVHQTIG